MSDAEEDLIESDEPSPTESKLRQRLDALVPPTVGRRLLAGVTVVAVALGLVAGYLVGHAPGQAPAEDRGSQSGAETRPSLPGGSVPYVPDGSPRDEGVIIYTLNGTRLALEDLTALGERPLPSGSGLNVASALAGVCSGSDSPTAPSTPIDNGAVGAVSFELTDTELSELITADLDVLAASTLRGKVELAQACRGGAVTVETDGVLAGIGDDTRSSPCDVPTRPRP